MSGVNASDELSDVSVASAVSVLSASCAYIDDQLIGDNIAFFQWVIDAE